MSFWDTLFSKADLGETKDEWGDAYGAVSPQLGTAGMLEQYGEGLLSGDLGAGPYSAARSMMVGTSMDTGAAAGREATARAFRFGGSQRMGDKRSEAIRARMGGEVQQGLINMVTQGRKDAYGAFQLGSGMRGQVANVAGARATDVNKMRNANMERQQAMISGLIEGAAFIGGSALLAGGRGGQIPGQNLPSEATYGTGDMGGYGQWGYSTPPNPNLGASALGQGQGGFSNFGQGGGGLLNRLPQMSEYEKWRQQAMGDGGNWYNSASSKYNSWDWPRPG
jgi:hypothetical protein|tara:strand:+ start:2376 stop:3215 length:840 start_codon:yes stop_codon:yes gene_type:complete